ncbi:hypothetical protein OROHE_007480 [Orobanche hederae]
MSASSPHLRAPSCVLFFCLTALSSFLCFACSFFVSGSIQERNFGSGLTSKFCSFDCPAGHKTADSKQVKLVQDENKLLENIPRTLIQELVCTSLIPGLNFQPICRHYTICDFCSIFWRVICQAIYTRYGLAVGANFIWRVRILMLISYPISYPVGKILDCVLGHNEVLFRRPQLKALVSIHCQELQVRSVNPRARSLKLVMMMTNVSHMMNSKSSYFEITEDTLEDEPLQMELNCVTTTGKGRGRTTSTDIFASSLVHKEDFYAAVRIKKTSPANHAVCRDFLDLVAANLAKAVNGF